MDQIEIAIGTYENLILGYRIDEKVGGGFTLESSFTTDSHRGALRCLAASAQGILASSSTDDSIRLHSLKKRKEVGSLFQHDGSVNCIRFFKGGYMFSASEDGTICLWKSKSWELLRVLKGHRCHVMAVAVHPSGKLGLSVGSDRMFFTWDLTTGKLAFKRKIDQVAQDILFTHDGSNYVLVYQKRIEVCSLEDTSVIQEKSFDSRINDACFVEENVLAVGSDNGEVTIVNVLSNTQLAKEIFKGRVRSLCTLTTKTSVLLFVASSNGCIRVCKLGFTEEEEKIETVVEYDSGARITCMTAYAPWEVLKEEVKPVKDKRKRKRKMLEQDGNNKKEDDEDESDDDSANDDEESEETVEDPNNLEEESEEEIQDEDNSEEDEEEEAPPKQQQKKRTKASNSAERSKKSKKQTLEKSDKLTKKEKSKNEKLHPKKKKAT